MLPICLTHYVKGSDALDTINRPFFSLSFFEGSKINQKWLFQMLQIFVDLQTFLVAWRKWLQRKTNKQKSQISMGA